MENSNSTLSAPGALASAVSLIRSEFPGVSLADFKALTDTDRIQLASAIAINRGLTAEQLSFTPVRY
jgi:hypothetical protein